MANCVGLPNIFTTEGTDALRTEKTFLKISHGTCARGIPVLARRAVPGSVCACAVRVLPWPRLPVPVCGEDRFSPFSEPLSKERVNYEGR